MTDLKEITKQADELDGLAKDVNAHVQDNGHYQLGVLVLAVNNLARAVVEVARNLNRSP